MALIGKIRNNSWILVVMIALGLGGFIIMDMTSGQQSLFGSSQMVMANIDGKKVEWTQFNRAESVLYGNSAGDVYARRNALWNYFVEEALVSEEAQDLGLGVSKTELLDLEFGPSPSPVIQQRFRDPNTQMLDRQRLNEFKTAIETGQFTDPNLRAFWAFQEKEIIKERLQAKINALVSKAMYTPTWMAEMGAQEENQRIDVAYVRVPFDEVDNTEVSLADSDFEEFIKENRSRFERKEEGRVVEYAAFNVKPTAEDSAQWRQQIVNLIPDLETTDNDSAFVERNLGVYDVAYYKKDQLNPAIADTLFSMPVGSVYGPYIDGRFYKAVKVIDRKVIPDSVRSRHILLPANDPTSFLMAQSRIDSLKNLIETGQATFDSLALKFGTDATRTKGGDLGYAGPGMMVKPFNDLIFYQAEEGKLATVVTQFGIHLVEVTGRKFINNDVAVKVAYLQQAIVPSEETQNKMYDQAFAFVGSNKKLDQLSQSVQNNPELSLESSPVLERNDFTVGNLPMGQAARDIVRWAFEAKKGDVSRDIYIFQDQVDLYNSQYVVVGLKDVIKPGLPPVAAVRAEIEPEVINRKKGELLADRLSGKDLTAAAAEFNLQVDTLQGLTFSQSVIANVGNEPKVIGTAFSLAENGVSAPVTGTTGVFLLKVLAKPQAIAAGDLTSVRRNMAATARSQVSYQLIQSLREGADITDNRSRFY